MSYGLSFTEQFFTGCDHSGVRVMDRPDTVVDALWTMRVCRNKTWQDMCRDVFGQSVVAIDDALARVRETNACSNLDSPVTVWIDEEGYYTVDVYEKE